MKVGLIFECGPEGADKKVCEHLARMLEPNIKIESITLTNKAILMQDCGKATAQLLADGCERVVIVWDLYPPWREKNDRPCRREEREKVMQLLKDAGVTSPNVFLVCIREELEAWLLADEQAISAFLSRPTHPVKINRVKEPEQFRNPKKHLIKLFKQNGRPEYKDLIHAEKIIKLTDLSRLKRCASFSRFADKVTGKEDILRRR